MGRVGMGRSCQDSRYGCPCPSVSPHRLFNNMNATINLYGMTARETYL